MYSEQQTLNAPDFYQITTGPAVEYTQYPGNDTLGGGIGGGINPPQFIPDQPPQPCRMNQHNFKCKHEKVCVCGSVQRLGLEVSDGL